MLVPVLLQVRGVLGVLVLVPVVLLQVRGVLGVLVLVPVLLQVRGVLGVLVLVPVQLEGGLGSRPFSGGILVSLSQPGAH